MQKGLLCGIHSWFSSVSRLTSPEEGAKISGRICSRRWGSAPWGQHRGSSIWLDAFRRSALLFRSALTQRKGLAKTPGWGVGLDNDQWTSVEDSILRQFFWTLLIIQSMAPELRDWVFFFSQTSLQHQTDGLWVLDKVPRCYTLAPPCPQRWYSLLSSEFPSQLSLWANII